MRDTHDVSEPTVNPVSARDVVILLTVLGRYEGEMRAGLLDDHHVEALGRRCVAAGLLAAGSEGSREAVADVLDEINQRLRFAIGEYDADPTNGK